MKRSTTIILIILLFISCNKTGGGEPPIDFLQSFLQDGPWRLISATKIDNNKNIVSIYKGTINDSIVFNYTATANGNIYSSKLQSIISGIYSECNYEIWMRNATVSCSPSWRNGSYGDTLFIKSFSDTLLVFNVNYTNGSINGNEIDSLRKIRFWN